MKNLYSITAALLITAGAFAQQIPNGSFENWSMGDPTGWNTINSFVVGYPSYGAIQSNDAVDGNSSLRLRSNQYDLTPFGFPIIDTTAYAFIGAPDSTGPHYGFPFAYRPVKLTYWYKYTPGTPQGNDVDTARVHVDFTLNGNKIGEAQKLHYGAAVSTWTYEEVLVNWTSATVPDTCRIDLLSSLTGIGISCDYISTNLIGNELMIDKLEFSYQTGVEESSMNNTIRVYPNPATDMIFLSKAPANAAYEIFDALGNTVVKGQLTGNSLNVADLADGIYFLQVIDGEEKSLVRFVVQ